MIQKLHLTQVFINPEQEFKSGDGRTFKSCRTALKAKEYGDKLLSGFASKETADELKADVSKGEYEIELDITESDKLDKNGKPYTNWKFVNKEAKSELEITNLKVSIANINKRLSEVESYIEDRKKGVSNADFTGKSARTNTVKEQEEIDLASYKNEISPEDIPF